MHFDLSDWKHDVIVSTTRSHFVTLLSLYALTKFQNQQNNKYYMYTWTNQSCGLRKGLLAIFQSKYSP